MGSMDILPSGFQTGYESARSNLLVRGLPSGVDEQTLVDIFSRFGDIQSCRLVPTTHSEAPHVGLVNLASPAQARDAVNALHGAPTDRGVLEVIAGPGQLASSRQQTPSDNLYVRHLPSNWSEQELRELFSPFGSIQESRILHRGDDVRGAGALVRMNNVDAASKAIVALNGHLPRTNFGEALTSHPLLVRYADSPEEKARKQARKEQMATRLHRSLDLPSLVHHDEPIGLRHSSLPAGFQAFSASGIADLGAGPATSVGLFSDPLQADASIDALLSSLGTGSHLSGDVNGLQAGSLGFSRFGSPVNANGLLQPPPPPPPPPPPMQAGTTAPGCASLYVKNLPPETDKLWLYERFAPHGAIVSVKVLQEDATLRCRGVGFVNFADQQGALNAIQNVNGLKVSDKHLHVSLQTTRSRT